MKRKSLSSCNTASFSGAQAASGIFRLSAVASAILSLLLISSAGNACAAIVSRDAGGKARTDPVFDLTRLPESVVSANSVTLKTAAAQSPGYVYDSLTARNGLPPGGNKLTVNASRSAGTYSGDSGVAGTVGNSVSINAVPVMASLSGVDAGTGATGGNPARSVTDSSPVVREAGSASNNSITYDNKTVTRDVYVGHALAGGGDANHNELTVNGGSVTGNVYAGKAEDNNGNANYNTVTLNNTTVNKGDTRKKVYAAFAWGDAIGNRLTINDSTVSYVQTAYGDRNVSDNHLTINGGTVMYAYAASTSGGIASDNHLTVNSGTVDVVTGASASTGRVENNHVTVNDGDIRQVTGGSSSTSGNVTGNHVLVTGGKITEFAYGGYSAQGGTVKGNDVTITGGEVFDVYGGRASTFNSEKNTVVITGGKVNNDVYGGRSASSSANGNEVSIDGVSVQNVYGGYSDASGVTVRNRVGITDATVSGEIVGGYVGNGNGRSAENAVTLDNVIALKDVTGGRSPNRAAELNVVEINGGSVAGKVTGGLSDTYTALNNKVTVTDATITGDVIGGSGKTKANDNEVTIGGNSTVKGNIYGGYIDDGITRAVTGTATGNTVTVSGNANISGANLYGGYRASGGAGQIQQGNTLNIDGFAGDAKNIGNFSTINFRNTLLSSNGAVLRLNDTSGTDLTGTSINLESVNLAGGGKPLQAGDTFSLKLIENTAGTLTGGNLTTASLQAMQGISLIYDLDISQLTGNALGIEATVRSTRVSSTTKTFSTSRLAVVEFLNQSSDMVLGYGMDKAVGSVQDGKGFGVFGALSGTETKNDLGSGIHAKASGTHYVMGVAGKLKRNTENDWIGGAYVQAGWGDITDSNPVRDAKGDTKYYGVGLIGKFMQHEGAAKGLYGQASLQVGHVRTTFDSNLRDGAGNRGSYDKESTYYGAALGVGYLKEINNNYSVDFLAQYKWLRLGKLDTRITGDSYRFDAVNSHRTRVGARLNYTANRQFTPYAGIAWEHEFSGKTKGTVQAYRLDDLSMKGSSGVAEVGVNFRPDANSRWKVDANVQGHFGQREGVQGMLAFNYRF